MDEGDLNDDVDGGGNPGLQYMKSTFSPVVSVGGTDPMVANLMKIVFEQQRTIDRLETSFKNQTEKQLRLETSFQAQKTSVNSQIEHLCEQLGAERNDRAQTEKALRGSVQSDIQVESDQRKQLEEKMEKKFLSMSELVEKTKANLILQHGERVQGAQDKFEIKIEELREQFEAERGARSQSEEALQESLRSDIQAEIDLILQHGKRVQGVQDAFEIKIEELREQLEAERGARSQSEEALQKSLRSDIQVESDQRKQLQEKMDSKFLSMSNHLEKTKESLILKHGETVQGVQDELQSKIEKLREQLETDRDERAQGEKELRQSVQSGFQVETNQRKQLEEQVDAKLRTISEHVEDTKTSLIRQHDETAQGVRDEFQSKIGELLEQFEAERLARCQLEENLEDFLKESLQKRELESEIEAMKGVQYGVPFSFLNDWTQHYDEPYSHITSEANLQIAWPGGRPASDFWVFMGARNVNSNEIAIAAVGDGSCLKSTKSTNKAELHRGAYWYNVHGMSCGFSGEPEIALSNADSKNGEHRLSWHLREYGGYRVGNAKALVYSKTWRKLLYWRPKKGVDLG